jgi:isoleucyl-tRNA synthetase
MWIPTAYLRGNFYFKKGIEMAEAPKKHFLAEIEEAVIKYWNDNHTFEKSMENRKGEKLFNFYDGPPFANGIPHYGHLEQTTIKDTVTRYKTMQGFYVPRYLGWDTHGLPVEYAIEKEHGFKGKKDILKYGIDKFNEDCRQSVYKYKDVWEKMFKRVGRWADYSKTYSTMDDSYMESVWWVFKTIYDKGLVYKDFRSSPYCPRCATPLSNFELNQGYQDNIEDPSLYVKFRLKDQDAYLLGWTTTPWSLPGNAAIAVKPEANYVFVSLNDSDSGEQETLVLARNRLEVLDSESYKIERELKGEELVGLRYEPLFKLRDIRSVEGSENLYQVIPAESVSIEDGSGILHVAPAFGEDDLLLGKQHNLPVLITVDENGHVKTDLGLPEDVAGKFFKSADDPIIEHLTKEDSVYAAEKFLHTYPFCWRCDTPLLYYATDSWLVKVTDLKEQLVSNNQQISWVPEHIKNGRFGKWLEQVRDWGISRSRFWGAAIPIWVTDDGEVVVIGSIDELKKRAVDPSKVKDLHRPYIDEVVIKTDSGKLAKRIPDVFDCWFESGAMPYGQCHYPFEGTDDWSKRFPAEFIAEAVDQTRGWFYTLHVLASALFDKPAFENAISSGWIVAADGEKLSKRKKNYAPMDEVFDQYGVDSLRFFISSSPLVNGEDTRFSVDFLRDVQRKVFMTLHSTYTFYELYAEVDGWKPEKELSEPKSDNILDQWMLSRLNQAIGEVTSALDQYRLDKATRPIYDLLDDLSNWFVRRSRRRFWKSQDDDDKKHAYETLFYSLTVTCQLIAPFSPFLSDDIWRKLVKGTDLPDSVHLSDWPKAGQVDSSLINKMSFVRESITQGLSERAASGIKVRQPLSKVLINDHKNVMASDKDSFESLILDELNVKMVEYTDKKLNDDENVWVKLDTKLSDELRLEGLARELIRSIQNTRKKIGLNVDDRINLSINTSDKDMLSAVDSHKQNIMAETLATSLNTAKTDLKAAVDLKVDGTETSISIEKAK